MPVRCGGAVLVHKDEPVDLPDLACAQPLGSVNKPWGPGICCCPDLSHQCQKQDLAAYDSCLRIRVIRVS
ncbi:hypothetical protein GCM10009742_49920 [Kribbella karoonensis]|uniref:Uncharacterized protein n=1 Tax=Kribbella karoonensis TaxID=324851 RepID=A0ABN2E6Q2_9ACTN